MKTKKILLPALAIIALPTLMLQSCKDKHIETRTFTANVPIYKSYDQMRTEVGSKETQPLKNPGKIYVFGSYILVNEFHKGIHVINNQDPYNPQNIGFLNIPGNVDISVKGNILYADSYTDLVAIDISDPKNIKETKRVKDVLQYSVPKYDERYPLAKIDETRGVIAGWEIKEVTETCLNVGLSDLTKMVCWFPKLRMVALAQHRVETQETQPLKLAAPCHALRLKKIVFMSLAA